MLEQAYKGDWRHSGWRYMWLLPCLIAADQLTKWLVWTHVPLHTGRAWLPVLNLVHAHNYGAAFSFMSVPGGAQLYLLTALAVLVSSALLYVLRRTPAVPCMLPVALLCVMSGALGNALDRMVHGFVIDFIDVHWQGYHWPAFNVADSLICVGVGCMIVLEVVRGR